jgi:acetyltransferase-like isoleucine patch superfamily enzyme
MGTLKIVVILLAVFVFGKYILIALIFPFQCMAVPYQKKKTLINKLFAAPYIVFDSRLLRRGWTRYMLYQVAYLPSHHLRRFIYKCLGLKMGKRNVFHFGTEIRDIAKIKMGDSNIIGDNALLDGRQGLILGNNVNLSSNVSIYTLQHDHRTPNFGSVGGKVVIGDRAWLSSNVIVLPGVTIGEGAVCCAGCVVAKDVEPYTVVAGIPAKKVNERPKDLLYEFDGRACRLY